MSNQLSMATHQSIETLHGSGHSNREIARLLSIDRGAVNKHVRLIRAESQALKESDSGSDEIQNRPNPRTGSTEKYDEKTSKLDHFPPKPWPVLTRKQVAGFNPRTDKHQQTLAFFILRATFVVVEPNVAVNSVCPQIHVPFSNQRTLRPLGVLVFPDGLQSRHCRCRQSLCIGTQKRLQSLGEIVGAEALQVSPLKVWKCYLGTGV